jgi:hypothetical protein
MRVATAWPFDGVQWHCSSERIIVLGPRNEYLLRGSAILCALMNVQLSPCVRLSGHRNARHSLLRVMGSQSPGVSSRIWKALHSKVPMLQVLSGWGSFHLTWLQLSTSKHLPRFSVTRPLDSSLQSFSDSKCTKGSQQGLSVRPASP